MPVAMVAMVSATVLIAVAIAVTVIDVMRCMDVTGGEQSGDADDHAQPQSHFPKSHFTCSLLTAPGRGELNFRTAR